MVMLQARGASQVESFAARLRRLESDILAQTVARPGRAGGRAGGFQPTRQEINKAKSFVLEALRRASPVDTGFLRASLRLQYRAPGILIITSVADYFQYQWHNFNQSTISAGLNKAQGVLGFRPALTPRFQGGGQRAQRGGFQRDTRERIAVSQHPLIPSAAVREVTRDTARNIERNMRRAVTTPAGDRRSIFAQARR